MAPPPPLTFLGISFWNGSAEELLSTADRAGGLLIVPAAPGMAQMRYDNHLTTAYRSSDWAVVDGAYIALILRTVFLRSARRISGLQLLQKLLLPMAAPAVPFRERRVLWVVPSPGEKDAIRSYLDKQGFDTGLQSYYEAPFYKTAEDYSDESLLQEILSVQPDWVVLCIGGGKQEKLGSFLRSQFDRLSERKPVILCTGGAISFLTGTQANIPTWADRMYLGWFLRILSNPKLFGARYFDAAWGLPKLLWMSRGSLFTEKANGKAR